MDEAFIFRKLNYQELILLEAIKYLEKIINNCIHYQMNYR